MSAYTDYVVVVVRELRQNVVVQAEDAQHARVLAHIRIREAIGDDASETVRTEDVRAVDPDEAELLRSRR